MSQLHGGQFGQRRVDCGDPGQVGQIDLPAAGIEDLRRQTTIGHGQLVAMAKAPGCGIVQHLFQRIYLDLHGYRLFAATSISA